MFLCGKSAIIERRHPDRHHLSEVTLLKFRESILKECNKRDDTWARDVMSRVNNCSDIVAAEARHQSRCSPDFLRASCNKSGASRSTDSGKQNWFEDYVIGLMVSVKQKK